MNQEKDKGHCNLENQCTSLVKILNKLNADDIKRITDIATGIALVRGVDLKQTKSNTKI